jgi:surface carbohydrate biosynthesis protein
LGNITGLESKVNLPSGIFHYTSCVPQKSVIDLFKRLKSKNFFISCQDEEGGVEEIKEFFTKPPKGNFYYRFGQKSLKLVDAIFSWSNFDYENLILRFSKYKKKIFNTGNPRVDMWSKNLTNFYNDKNNSKKFILINSSLIGPTSNKTMLENLEIMKKSFYDNSTFKFERDKIYYFDEFIAYTKFLKVFHNSIIKLAKTFKKQKFIFRPHPTESLELWKFFFRDYKNILVTKEHSSTYWMHKSKILIHCGCYTSIEASNLGLDIITYVPRELKKYAKPFPASLGLYCTSEKNLAKLINNILNSKSKKKYQYQKLKNFNKVNSRFHFPSKKLNAQKNC